jgi:hypothetical protein
LLGQKKVTKEKATLLRRPFDKLRASFGLLANWAAAQLARSASRSRAQTVLADTLPIFIPNLGGAEGARKNQEQLSPLPLLLKQA